MPTLLKVVIGIVAAGAIGDLVQESYVAFVVDVFIVFALVRGHEGMRTALLWLAGLSLVYALFLGTVAAFQWMTPGAPRPPASDMAPLAAFWTLALAKNVLTIYALRRPDVQAWMFAKSVGDTREDT